MEDTKIIDQLNPALTAEDLQNLMKLINKTPIVGGEAEVVAMLKYKLTTLLTPATAAPPVPDQVTAPAKPDKAAKPN